MHTGVDTGAVTRTDPSGSDDMRFTSEIPVRFGDTDYARVVYYPTLLHLLHIAFEDLLERHAYLPYAQLLAERNLGFPSVRLECDFLGPVRYGEVLRVATTISELGRSSVAFRHEATVVGATDARCQVLVKRVAVDMTTFKPVPLPEDLRRAFEKLRE